MLQRLLRETFSISIGECFYLNKGHDSDRGFLTDKIEKGL